MHGAGEFNWIIADGSVTPVARVEYPNATVLDVPHHDNAIRSMMTNVMAALEHSSRSLVVFIEDDDWYRADYLKVMLGYFNHVPGLRLLGPNRAAYYHLRTRLLKIHENVNHSSLGTTVMHHACKPFIMDQAPLCIRNNFYALDVKLWGSRFFGHTIERDGLTLSLKGMSHLGGVTESHDGLDVRRKKHWTHSDEHLCYLRRVLGPESSWYDKYVEDYQKPDIAKSLRLA